MMIILHSLERFASIAKVEQLVLFSRLRKRKMSIFPNFNSALSDI